VNKTAANVAACGILQAIETAGPEGAKGGVLYAALMILGYTFAEYQAIIGALQGGGLVQRHTLERYTLTDKGRTVNARITDALRKAA